MKKLIRILALAFLLAGGMELPNFNASAATAKSVSQTSAVRIISIKSPAARNSTETLTAKVSPNSTAYITVHYKSGPSKAKGLEPKRSNSSGMVSWSWHVGGNTTLGMVTVTVTCKGHSANTQFKVVH